MMSQEEDDRMQLAGSIEARVNFKIPDLVALVKQYPDEWRRLTAGELVNQMGQGASEVDRLPVFLNGFLLERVHLDIGFSEHLSTFFDDQEHTYTWSQERAEELMQRLPPELRFRGGELLKPEDLGPQPMEGDVPLFDLEVT